MSASIVSAAQDDQLLIIVHPSVEENALDEDTLSAIYRLSKRAWGNGDAIIPYNYDVGNNLRVRFDSAVLHFDEDQAARFWIDFRIRGGGAPPRKVPSAATMVRVVARLKGAIGYVPASTPIAGTKLVARIVDNKVLPGSGR